MKHAIWVLLVVMIGFVVLTTTRSKAGADSVVDAQPRVESVSAGQEVASFSSPIEGVVQVEARQATEAIGELNRRLTAMEYEIARNRIALDECRNGRVPVLVLAKSLPEWPNLDETQRRTVIDFLERFPVTLGSGEALLVATHTSNGGDRMAELIALLGRERVLASMTAEARARMETDDPQGFADYFR